MSYFHVDGFLFFLLMGEFFAMLIKSFFHRIKRWASHVRYMTKLAGGTLLVDVEANYWLKKIEDPMYRPIWRWYYGQKWNKKYPSGVAVRRKKSFKILKIAAVISVILIILIGLVALFGVPSIVPEPVPATLGLSVIGYWNMTESSIGDASLGPVFNVNGTNNPAGNYSGGWVGLVMILRRTDTSNADMTVFLNVTSKKFIGNSTPLAFADRAYYLIPDGAAFLQTDVLEDGSGQLGISISVPAHGQNEFYLYLHFRAFNSYFYQSYVTIRPPGSGTDSLVGISGGYSGGGI
jgi:hypothetical protein